MVHVAPGACDARALDSHYATCSTCVMCVVHVALHGCSCMLAPCGGGSLGQEVEERARLGCWRLWTKASRACWDKGGCGRYGVGCDALMCPQCWRQEDGECQVGMFIGQKTWHERLLQPRHDQPVNRGPIIRMCHVCMHDSPRAPPPCSTSLCRRPLASQAQSQPPVHGPCAAKVVNCS